MFKGKESRKVVNVEPMRMHEETYCEYSDVNEGDIVVATVTSFIPPDVMLKVGDIDAIIHLEDFDIISDNNPIEKIKKSIVGNIGRKVMTRVVSKKENILVLERASIIRETKIVLNENIGAIVDATVEKIVPFGLFVDIGNGIVSLIPQIEISKSRVYDLNAAFKIGDVVKVRLLDYERKSGFFIISRKQAYNVINENDLPVGACVQVAVGNYVNEQKDGVYVEYNPASTGIVDIPQFYSADQFVYGRKIAVFIEKYTERGFKANFTKFID